MYTALTPNSLEVSLCLHRFVCELEDWSENSNIYLDAGVLEFLSDAVFEVPNGLRYIVWTTQAERSAHLTGILNLAWGFDGKPEEEAREFGEEIVEFLAASGRSFSWDGSLKKTIGVDIASVPGQDKDSYTLLGLLVLPKKYAAALEDCFGWNESDDYGLDLPGDIGHCYIEMRDGESLLEAVRREERIPADEILAYQRCISDENSIIDLEPYTHWDSRYLLLVP